MRVVCRLFLVFMLSGSIAFRFGLKGLKMFIVSLSFRQLQVGANAAVVGQVSL